MNYTVQELRLYMRLASEMNRHIAACALARVITNRIYPTSELLQEDINIASRFLRDHINKPWPTCDYCGHNLEIGHEKHFICYDQEVTVHKTCQHELRIAWKHTPIRTWFRKLVRNSFFRR